MDIELKTEMYAAIDYLRHLGTSNECPPFGICFNIGDRFANVWIYLSKRKSKLTVSKIHFIFESWPHFSGNFSYPVPSDHPEVNAMDAYHNLHRWTGKYGKLRRNLCLHMADWLENHIKECENEDQH